MVRLGWLGDLIALAATSAITPRPTGPVKRPRTQRHAGCLSRRPPISQSFGPSPHRPRDRCMELTVQNVYGLLLRSKLLSVDDARSMFARWKEESKDSTNLVQFASWMVANKYLTEYQATLLARGHADGFFLGD